MNGTTVDQVIQDARQLSAAEQLRVVSVLYRDLRAQLSPHVVSLEGRWSDLSVDFDADEIERELRDLHRRSWQHLEAELDE